MNKYENILNASLKFFDSKVPDYFLKEQVNLRCFL